MPEGITHEAMTPPFQLAVEFVEQDVRQQRRERAALRRPFLPSAGDPTRHLTGLEVPPDQSEHAFIYDLARHVRHQEIVVDPVKEFLKIEFHAPAMPCRHMGAGCTDRKFNRMRPSMARVLGLETRSAKEG